MARSSLVNRISFNIKVRHTLLKDIDSRKHFRYLTIKDSTLKMSIEEQIEYLNLIMYAYNCFNIHDKTKFEKNYYELNVMYRELFRKMYLNEE